MVGRAELNAEDRDDGLSNLDAARWNIPPRVLGARRRETSCPLMPLSIPSNTRPGDFGSADVVFFLVGDIGTSKAIS